MKNYLVLFREPDGRSSIHPQEAINQHQLNWKSWLEKNGKEGKITGGNSLTLNGRIIKGKDEQPVNDIHKTGTEIIGGFLLIKAADLNKATALIQTCPIFEFGGYAEVREIK